MYNSDRRLYTEISQETRLTVTLYKRCDAEDTGIITDVLHGESVTG